MFYIYYNFISHLSRLKWKIIKRSTSLSFKHLTHFSTKQTSSIIKYYCIRFFIYTINHKNMTRLIVLTELINPKKEISFSLSSISQHQSNYHNLVLKPRYSKPANLLTSLETPPLEISWSCRKQSADLVNNNLTQPSISQPTTRRKMVPRHQHARTKNHQN